MEFFIVVNAMLDGREVTTCPYIWVDRDFALMRGWFQGFPKKLGSVWMTRHFGLQNGAEPGLQPGATFGGTLRRQRPAARAGHGHAREHDRHGPDAQRAAARQRAPLPAPQRRPARAARRARARGLAQPRPLDARRSGRARRRSSCSARPNEEHTALAPVRMGKGFRFTFAYTVDDQVDRRRSADRRADGGASAEHPRARVAGAEVSVDHYIGGRRVAERRDVRGSLAARLVAARRGLARRRRDRRCSRSGRRSRRSRRGRRSAPPAARCTSSAWPT